VPIFIEAGAPFFSVSRIVLKRSLATEQDAELQKTG
jgi:hypothetical protein